MTTEKEREANRERQRAFRARKKAEQQEAEQQEQQEQRDANESAEMERRAELQEASWLNQRKLLGLVFLGEIKPGIDASTATEEIQVAREFARALNQPDVQPGETVRGFVKRIYEAWYGLGASKLRAEDFVVNGEGSWFEYHSRHRGAPLFNRETQRFDTRMIHHFSGRSFEQSWRPPEGTGNEVIDVASLAELPTLRAENKN